MCHTSCIEKIYFFFSTNGRNRIHCVRVYLCMITVFFFFPSLVANPNFPFQGADFFSFPLSIVHSSYRLCVFSAVGFSCLIFTLPILLCKSTLFWTLFISWLFSFPFILSSSPAHSAFSSAPPHLPPPVYTSAVHPLLRARYASLNGISQEI